MSKQSAFTLLELLIVIGILAVLMSVAVIAINPAELLKNSRDVRRMSDLNTINKSLGIFEVSSSDSIGSASTVYVSIPDSSATCTNLSLSSLPAGYSYSCSSETNYRKTDGTGWIPANFESLDIKSPISALPIDPTNTTSTGLYYTYTSGG